MAEIILVAFSIGYGIYYIMHASPIKAQKLLMTGKIRWGNSKKRYEQSTTDEERQEIYIKLSKNLKIIGWGMILFGVIWLTRIVVLVVNFVHNLNS